MSYYGYGGAGRKQVQVSMHQRDLDKLNELIGLVIKETPGGWHPRKYKKIDRSSVIIDLVEAELHRRKKAAPGEDAAKEKRKAKTQTDPMDH
jgi:hypothetical protein